MAPGRLVAIHQPNFFPWLGYFEKLMRSDVFVLLDHVQFPKKGGTPINRVQVLVNGDPVWVTAPVVRSFHGTRSIAETEVEESKPWREKLAKSLASTYAKTPHFDEVFEVLEPLIAADTSLLAAYNESAIRELADRLEIETELVRSSELASEEAATDMLVELIGAVGGDGYLSGGGAGGYQEDEKFARAGIELVRQDFQHPEYPQRASEAVAGLSVIDAMMSCGFDGTAGLLRN